MKFLQTSDWHLGKTLHEMSLMEDQKVFLEQVLEELRVNDYDGLLIPGDIYDRPIPPADAVKTLSIFLSKVHNEFPDLEVFLLAGNHDSAERLSFLKEILSEMKIHISTDTENYATPVILEKKGERCCIYQLPFLYSGALKDENGNVLRKQNELYEKACNDILKNHKEKYSDCFSVFCGHLMTVKSKVSDSERSFVGTAEEVDASVFEGFDYTALGHLHSVQKAGNENNIYYAGSPLSYSFDDTKEKFFLSVTLRKENEKTDVQIEKIPVKPMRNVVSVTGKFEDFYENKDLIEKYKDFYLEICVEDSVVPEGAVSLLRTKYPYLLSFRRLNQDENFLVQDFSERKKAVESNDPMMIFEQFMTETYGSEVHDLLEEEKKLFIKFLTDSNESESGNL